MKIIRNRAFLNVTEFAEGKRRIHMGVYMGLALVWFSVRIFGYGKYFSLDAKYDLHVSVTIAIFGIALLYCFYKKYMISIFIYKLYSLFILYILSHNNLGWRAWIMFAILLSVLLQSRKGLIQYHSGITNCPLSFIAFGEISQFQYFIKKLILFIQQFLSRLKNVSFEGWTLTVSSLGNIIIALIVMQYSATASVMIGIAALLGFRKALSSWIPSSKELQKIDNRKPILLLRSFEDDDMPIKNESFQPGLMNSYRQSLSFEEVIAKQSNRFGPLITISEPGEDIPPLGAAREHFDSENWRTRIESFFSEAKAIIIVIGKSPGLLWELTRLFELGMTKKLILIFPPVEESEFRERLNQFLQIPAINPVFKKISIQDYKNLLVVCINKKSALCRLVWVIKFELTRDKVNHVDEIVDIPVSSCPFFGQLNFAVDTFEDAV